MNTISLQFNDGSNEESVEAEYYVIEKDWITLKNEEHKMVAAYREERVDRMLVLNTGRCSDPRLCDRSIKTS